MRSRGGRRSGTNDASSNSGCACVALRPAAAVAPTTPAQPEWNRDRTWHFRPRRPTPALPSTSARAGRRRRRAGRRTGGAGGGDRAAAEISAPCPAVPPALLLSLAISASKPRVRRDEVRPIDTLSPPSLPPPHRDSDRFRRCSRGVADRRLALGPLRDRRQRLLHQLPRRRATCRGPTPRSSCRFGLCRVPPGGAVRQRRAGPAEHLRRTWRGHATRSCPARAVQRLSPVERRAATGSRRHRGPPQPRAAGADARLCPVSRRHRPRRGRRAQAVQLVPRGYRDPRPDDGRGGLRDLSLLPGRPRPDGRERCLRVPGLPRGRSRERPTGRAGRPDAIRHRPLCWRGTW